MKQLIGQRIARWGRLLPPARDEAMRFLPWVIALMAYVAALSAIGIIVLEGTLAAADRSLGTTLTLQVPADTSSLRLETIVAVLRRTKGVVSEHLFEPEETAKLLAPWLGPAVPLDELPVPRLIDVRIDPAAPPDLATLHRQLASVLPQARLDDHRGSVGSMRAPARRIEILLAALALLALLLVAASATYASRAALMVQQSEFEVLHLLGATDADIAAEFGLRYLWLGLLGAAAGMVATIVSVALLERGGALIQLAAPAAAKGIGDWRLWAVVIGLVGAAGLIAMASARLSVLRWLGRMP